MIGGVVSWSSLILTVLTMTIFPSSIFFGHMTILFEGDSTRVAEALQYIPFLLPTSFFQ